MVITFFLVLFEVGDELHKAREFWGIGENCPCKSQTSLEGKQEDDENQDKKIESLTSVEQTSEADKLPPEESKPSCEPKNETLSDVTLDEVKVKLEDEEKTKSVTFVEEIKNLQDVSRVAISGEDQAEASVEMVDEDNDSNYELNTLGHQSMGALSLVMDYISPMSSPAGSPQTNMEIEEDLGKYATF